MQLFEISGNYNKMKFGAGALASSGTSVWKSAVSKSNKQNTAATGVAMSGTSCLSLGAILASDSFKTKFTAFTIFKINKETNKQSKTKTKTLLKSQMR